jgi:hypothetical protein
MEMEEARKNVTVYHQKSDQIKDDRTSGTCSALWTLEMHAKSKPINLKGRDCFENVRCVEGSD